MYSIGPLVNSNLRLNLAKRPHDDPIPSSQLLSVLIISLAGKVTGIFDLPRIHQTCRITNTFQHGLAGNKNLVMTPSLESASCYVTIKIMYIRRTTNLHGWLSFPQVGVDPIHESFPLDPLLLV